MIVSQNFVGIEVDTIDAIPRTPETYTLSLVGDFLSDFSLAATTLFDIPKLTALPSPNENMTIDEINALADFEKMEFRYKIQWDCQQDLKDCSNIIVSTYVLDFFFLFFADFLSSQRLKNPNQVLNLIEA